jgi:hypothetical protein
MRAVDETADWKTYRNEEYGFEFEYPSDYLVRELDRITITKPIGEEGYSAGVEIYLESDRIDGFPAIGSPVLDTSELSFEEFANYAAREHCFVKGTMGMVSCDKVIKQTSFMLLSGIEGYEIYVNVVDMGVERDEEGEIIETKSTESEKGPIFALDVAEQTNNKLRGIFFEPYITLSDLTKKEEAENTVENLLNQIVFTLGFVETVSVWPEVASFDLNDKTFEGKIWASDRAVKILTTDSTSFYRTSEPDWEKEYWTFLRFYSSLQNWVGPPWPFKVKGIYEEENTLRADEIFLIAQ